MVSGAAVTDDISDNILKIEETGKQLAEELEGRMMAGHDKAFYSKFSQDKYQTFTSAEKKGTLKNSAKEEIRIQKNVLGKLLAEALKGGTPVDFE